MIDNTLQIEMSLVLKKVSRREAHSLLRSLERLAELTLEDTSSKDALRESAHGVRRYISSIKDTPEEGLERSGNVVHLKQGAAA